MFKNYTGFFLLLILTSFISCMNTHHVSNTVKYHDVRVERKGDQAVSNTVAPYKRQLDAEMNAVIGENVALLEKAQPESTLGNWAADAIFAQAEHFTNQKLDFAILNYGGLRIPSIPAGNITKGKIFELMPFDNMIVVVKMPGKELDQLFQHIAQQGGWPVSSAVQLKVNKEGKATTAKINGKTLDPNKTYLIATIDYLANGGDNCSFFKEKDRIETGQFMRTATIKYVEQLTAGGKKIQAKVEGRIIIE